MNITFLLLRAAHKCSHNMEGNNKDTHLCNKSNTLLSEILRIVSGPETRQGSRKMKSPPHSQCHCSFDGVHILCLAMLFSAHVT